MNNNNRYTYSWKLRDWVPIKDSIKFNTDDYNQYPLFDVSVDNDGIIKFRHGSFIFTAHGTNLILILSTCPSKGYQVKFQV